MYKIPETQVISLAQVQGTILGYVQNAQVLLLAVTAIAIFIAAVGVINTILMSVYERTGEIGIMKAVGASTNDIFLLIWLENPCCLLHRRNPGSHYRLWRQQFC